MAINLVVRAAGHYARRDDLAFSAITSAARPGARLRFLQQQGQSRTPAAGKISAYRGMITDRNGELLAVSTLVQSIFVNPQKLTVKIFRVWQKP